MQYYVFHSKKQIPTQNNKELDIWISTFLVTQQLFLNVLLQLLIRPLKMYICFVKLHI